jgi:hypothetical protein
MRILICLNRDLESHVALNLLLPALARHEVKVGLTERIGASVVIDDPPAAGSSGLPSKPSRTKCSSLG